MSNEKPSETTEGEARGDKVMQGDLAYLDYDMFIMRPDGEELFETTREESAKANDVYDERKVYEEVPFIAGEKRFLPGLDEALVGAEIGKEMSIVIPPEKGAGARDPKLVEMRSMREFSRMNIVPEVGKEVVIGNRRGTIVAVYAGRVRVDYNNPLAGFDVKYNYTVTRKAGTREEKVRGIIDMDYGSSEEFRLQIRNKTAEILLPDACKYDEKWFIAKYKVVSDLRKFADLRLIRFVEEYRKKEKDEEQEKAADEKSKESKGNGKPSRKSEEGKKEPKTS